MALPKKGKLKSVANEALAVLKGQDETVATVTTEAPVATKTYYPVSDARDDHYHGYFRNPWAGAGGFFTGD